MDMEGAAQVDILDIWSLACLSCAFDPPQWLSPSSLPAIYKAVSTPLPYIKNSCSSISGDV